MSYDYYILEQYTLQKEGYPDLKIRKLRFLGNERWESQAYIDQYKVAHWQKMEIQDETIIREHIEKYGIKE